MLLKMNGNPVVDFGDHFQPEKIESIFAGIMNNPYFVDFEIVATTTLLVAGLQYLFVPKHWVKRKAFFSIIGHIIVGFVTFLVFIDDAKQIYYSTSHWR